MTDENQFTALVLEEDDEHKVTATIQKLADDRLPEGDVTVGVEYSSLNYKDALSASGHRGVGRRYPHTPGIDAAGVVCRSRSAAWREEDQVIVTGHDLGSNTSGGLAGRIRVPADWVVALPADMTARHSMAM